MIAGFVFTGVVLLEEIHFVISCRRRFAVSNVFAVPRQERWTVLSKKIKKVIKKWIVMQPVSFAISMADCVTNSCLLLRICNEYSLGIS